jgi:chitin disaccharide deacetylase
LSRLLAGIFSMPCRLIINGDDFGSSAGANQAILALHDEGIITSASLMMGGSAAREAVAHALERPRLAVGLHLALVGARALLPHNEIPHLTRRDGCFRWGHIRAGLAYTLLKACRRELQREAAAQFKTFACTGLCWSHVDSHVHLTVTPAVFRTALALCRQYPVVGFRVPEDDFSLYSRLEPSDAGRQRWLALYFAAACAWQRRVLRTSGLVTTRRCFGLFRSGRLDAPYLERVVACLPDGDYELHCHPDLSTEPGKAEYEALRSPAFRRALKERDVIPATYATLA